MLAPLLHWACNGYATSSPGDDPQQITRQVARYLF
jgi:hypothetical protein